MTSTRTQLQADLGEFLGSAGPRPRAVLLVGEPGIGKSVLLDRVHADLLAGGMSDVVAIDDADLVDADRVERVRQRLVGDTRCRLLVAGTRIDAGLLAMVERACERRIITLGALSSDEARDVLVDVSIPRYGFHAQQAIERSGGNPRRLVDEAFGAVDLAQLDGDDPSFARHRWSDGAARRLQLALDDRSEELEAFVAACAQVASGGPLAEGLGVADAADAIAVTADVARLAHDTERAIQLGERAVTIATTEPVRIWAAAVAAAARASRGEPVAMLSLHALAGKASRLDRSELESAIWWLVAWSSMILGDTTTAQRAAIRGTAVADEANAVALALRCREAIAYVLLAAGDATAALPYFEEIGIVARHRGLHAMALDAMTARARGLMAIGRHAEAATLADEVLAVALQHHAPCLVIVEVKVVAARAHASTGSIGLAHASLGDPAHVVARASSHGAAPEFWIALEAIRIAARPGGDAALLQEWIAALRSFDADGHCGALRAAHAEAEAWNAVAGGRRSEAARLAARARQLWAAAECHDEVAHTDALTHAGAERVPRIGIFGSSAAARALPEDPEVFEALTKREREIARYVAGGLTNPEIARELHLSPRTVEHHVASILRKLELPSRRVLVRGRV